jgi:hypothetical protein
MPRRHFVHHKSHLPDLGANTGRRGEKTATNRFSYGAVPGKIILLYILIFMFLDSRREDKRFWTELHYPS